MFPSPLSVSARALVALACLGACAQAQAQAPARALAPLPPTLSDRLAPRVQLPALVPQMQLLRAYDPAAAYDPRDSAPVQAGRIHAGHAFEFTAGFRGLPEGALTLELDRSRYPAGSVELRSQNLLRATDGEQRWVLNVVVRDAAVPGDGVVHLHLIAKVTGADRSVQVFPLSHGHVIVTRMKRYTWTRTAELADMFELQPTHGPRTSACEGESWTPAGTYPVGKSTRDGKMVLTIRSGPLGTHCGWISRTQNPPALGYPGRVIALNWTARASDQCIRPSPQFTRERVPDGMLRADWIQVGNGRQVIESLNLSPQRLPVMLVGMRCNNTLLNDHFLEVTWDSVEIEIPEDRPTSGLGMVWG